MLQFTFTSIYSHDLLASIWELFVASFFEVLGHCISHPLPFLHGSGFLYFIINFRIFFKPFKKSFFGFWYLRENATQVSHSSSSLYFCVTVEVSGWRCSIPFEICWQKSTQTEIFDFNKASKIWILKACSLENWVGSSSGVFCPRQSFNHFLQGAPS